MPTFEKPSVADLRHAADQLGMNPSMMYLNAVQDIVAPLCAAYAALDAVPDEKPAVKYPRDDGWRPSAAENPFSTRAKLKSTRTRIPWMLSSARSCFCEAIAARVHSCSCR